jgi:transmembrane sensor
MSGADVKTPIVGNSKDIDRQAAAWLQRQQFWNWTGEDQAEFSAWLDQATAHRIAFVRVSDAWKRTHRLTVLRDYLHAQAVAKADLRLWPGLMKVVAALIAIAALGTGAVIYLSAPREEIIATAIGGHRVVTLHDGSTIELSTDTVVRISQTNEARTVKLDKGEAYFQVKHSATRLFTVAAGNRQLTDLGTKFVVRRDPDRLDVSVVEGRVLFDAKQNAHRQITLLNAGDELVATESAVTQLKRSPLELSNTLAWRRGVLVFKNMPLVDAIAEFNRYHSEKLIVLDSATGRLTIGGTFETGNIRAFTEVAQDVLGLRAATRGNEIVLSR